MLKGLASMIRQESITTAKKTVENEVKKTIDETKETISVKTDKMVNGKNGKLLIFAAIGISCVALAVAIGKGSAKTIVVNVYTCK